MPQQPESQIVSLEKMQHAFDAGQWQVVVELSLLFHPSSAYFLESRQLAAIAQFQLGHLELALDVLKQVIDTDHHNPNLYLNYANLLALASQLEESVLYYNKSLSLNSNSAVAQHNLGSVLFDLKQFAAAEEHFKKAINLDPNYWQAYSSIGNTYFSLKQNQLALENYQKALQLNSNDLSLINNYALTLLAVGNLELSAKFYRKALQLDPENANLFIPLSAILNTLNHKQDADKVLKQGVKRAPWYLSQTHSKSALSLISFSGLQHAAYTLDSNNQVNLDGGHFYSKYLIDEEKFNRYRYHIFNKNIESEKSLPQSQLYINTISDPDLEMHSLKSLLIFLDKQSDVAIINHPEKVIETTRDKNYQRLKKIDGLYFPKTLRLFVKDPDLASKDILKQFDFPVLIRMCGTQTGTSFVQINSNQELKRNLCSFLNEEIYIIEYVDTSFTGEHQDKLFRRFRFFFIENKTYPVTCHIHHSWNVHSVDRSSVMQQQNDLTQIEKQFLLEPASIIGDANFKVLAQLPQIIGLDFFGVDFSLTKANQLVLFEVNAAMNHSYNYVDQFPYLKPHLDAITNGFHEMIENKAKLLK